MPNCLRRVSPNILFGFLAVATFVATVGGGCQPAGTSTGAGGAAGTVATGGSVGSGGGVAVGTGGTGQATGGAGTTTGTGGRVGATGGGSASSGGNSGAGGSATSSGGSVGSTGGTGIGGKGATGGSGGVNGGVGGTAGTSIQGNSVEIYDPTRLPRFDIDLPPASVTALKAITGPNDPAQDTWVTGTFTYDKGGKNEVVNNIGVRLKGEGSFQKFDQKPALKVKFDEFVPDQEFRGLARLVLNNNNDDSSFVAERLAYDVYRAAGVPAPRCNSALVYVNNAFYGVYTNLESEDKHFLARWFPNVTGNLYEKNGMMDLLPAAMADFDLETNETVNNRTDLTQLLTAIQGATKPASYLQDIGAKMDTAEFLKFTAVEGAVNQWDTYAYSIWWAHNFRVYNDPATNKFVFIPWGHDLSMKPAPFTSKAYVKLFDLARQSDSPSGPVTAGLLFQRCLTSPDCKTAYKDAVNKVITAYEGLGMEAAATRYYNQIKAQVNLDTRKSNENGPVTNAQFDTAYQSVLTTIRGRVAAMRADLAAN